MTDSASIAEAYTNFEADKSFHLHTRLLAKEVDKGGNRVFMYYFSKVPSERYPAKFGAFHGAEIVYALDNLDNDPGTIGSGVISKQDQDYANMVSQYWANFATKGDPNGVGLAEWPIWDVSNQKYIELGDRVESKQFLLKNRLDGLVEFIESK